MKIVIDNKKDVNNGAKEKFHGFLDTSFYPDKNEKGERNWSHKDGKLKILDANVKLKHVNQCMNALLCLKDQGILNHISYFPVMEVRTFIRGRIRRKTEMSGILFTTVTL